MEIGKIRVRMKWLSKELSIMHTRVIETTNMEIDELVKETCNTEYTKVLSNVTKKICLSSCKMGRILP